MMFSYDLLNNSATARRLKTKFFWRNTKIRNGKHVENKNSEAGEIPEAKRCLIDQRKSVEVTSCDLFRKTENST